MTDAFPSALVGPSAKERKYDRQLRLWAASGQQALEESRVLLVSSDGPIGPGNTGVSGVVGIETLKNLVLPGIGGFTIVDPATVTENDLGLNFFLEEGSLGKSRAEETCRLLKELNPDVEGHFFSKPIGELLKEPGFLPQYKLVVVSGPLKHSSLKLLCVNARELGIPLLYTHSVGFYSIFSLQVAAEFPIVETHPDPETTQDLRLVSPWPELIETAKRIDNLDTLDDHQHGHVPYVLLILHYLEQWKKTHNGNVPASYKEKSEFREMVRAGARTNNPEGGEENFDEAVAAVLKTLNPFSLRSSIRGIFEMEECKNPRQNSNNFWLIAFAIRTFYQKHGVLPLPGLLPDMKAQSEDYISLQNIVKAIRNNIALPESLMPIFVAFLVLDAVVSEIQEGQHQGGSLDDDNIWNTQFDRVVDSITQADPSLMDEEARGRILQAMQELRRTDGGELHNISALTGGLVAQEALKVITRQYVPLDNTCIFDGVRSRSEMYKL